MDSRHLPMSSSEAYVFFQQLSTSQRAQEEDKLPSVLLRHIFKIPLQLIVSIAVLPSLQLCTSHSPFGPFPLLHRLNQILAGTSSTHNKDAGSGSGSDSSILE